MMETVKILDVKNTETLEGAIAKILRPNKMDNKKDGQVAVQFQTQRQ